mgnify:CR=1 FL=1
MTGLLVFWTFLDEGKDCLRLGVGVLILLKGEAWLTWLNQFWNDNIQVIIYSFLQSLPLIKIKSIKLLVIAKLK